MIPVLYWPVGVPDFSSNTDRQRTSGQHVVSHVGLTLNLRVSCKWHHIQRGVHFTSTCLSCVSGRSVRVVRVLHKATRGLDVVVGRLSETTTTASTKDVVGALVGLLREKKMRKSEREMSGRGNSQRGRLYCTVQHTHLQVTDHICAGFLHYVYITTPIATCSAESMYEELRERMASDSSCSVAEKAQQEPQ